MGGRGSCRAAINRISRLDPHVPPHETSPCGSAGASPLPGREKAIAKRFSNTRLLGAIHAMPFEQHFANVGDIGPLFFLGGRDFHIAQAGD